MGGYVAAYTGTPAVDGENMGGNAATSQVQSGLNAYLATVVSSRPAGPVTVHALTTSSTTPTIQPSTTKNAPIESSTMIDHSDPSAGARSVRSIAGP